MLSFLIFTLFVSLSFLNARPLTLRDKRASNDKFDLLNGLKYLSTFGYDIPQFDNGKAPLLTQERVEWAIMDFQMFAGLEVTGELDDDTVELMKTPRCGVKDGQNSALNSKYKLQGSRWEKETLSYRVSKYNKSPNISNSELDLAVETAFKMWEDKANISFSNKEGGGEADIDIRFETFKHGDDDPFDGPGGTLAHAFFPQFGRDLHMDDSEPWSLNSPEGINTLQTLTHEIGHSLGLEHSWNRSSVMAPFYKEYDPSFKLEKDDIEAIQDLYGKREVNDDGEDDYDDGEDDNDDGEDNNDDGEDDNDEDDNTNDEEDDTNDEEDDTNDEEDDTEEDKALARQLQIFLRFSGFNPGKMDGDWGKMTTKALQRFLNSQGANLKVDGDFGRLTVMTLHKYLNNLWGAGLETNGTFGDKTKAALLNVLRINNADLDWIANLPLK